MPGFREAGVLGASVALAGGLAYVIWTHVSSGWTGREEPPRPETQRPEQDAAQETKREEEEQDDEPAPKDTDMVSAAEPLLEAQDASTTESKPVEKGTQVLVLGLDGAGKTSVLHCFATGSLEQDVEPTQGFNAVSINREDLQIEFLEIGGQEHLRQYWPKYIAKAMVLVFVVDSTDAERFPVAKKHLHELVSADPHLPLVILANKQDLPAARSITELHDALALAAVGDRRKLFLIGTHVKRGEAPRPGSGVQDARDLIVQMVCDGR